VLAADLLSRRDDPATVRSLAHALGSRRSFWGTRAAAAGALGHIRSPAAFAVLAEAIRVRHPKVRRAVAQALGHYRTPAAAELLRKLTLADPSVLVAATASRALGATRRPDAFDTLVEVIDRESWADTLRVGAIEGLGQLRDRRAIEHLEARSRYGVPARGRRAAIAALAELSTSRRVREHLEQLFDDGDPLLRGSVAEALAELGDVKARDALLRQLDRDLDARVRRRIREVLRDLAAKGKKELRRLRDDIDQLRREHGELKARVSKIEGRTGGSHRAAPKRRARGRRRR
jgi:aminopeptidase N